MPADRPDDPRGPGEGAEVEALHRALLREPPEPLEGREPAPLWLWAMAVVLLFWGGWYLGRYGGRLGPFAHDLGPSEGAPPLEAPPPSGVAIYAARCAVCHQANGQGVPGAFPPIVGSEWVTGDPSVPVRIVLRGLQGPIDVAGQPYQGAMPPWADLLDDAQIAAVITHERQMAGISGPPVEEELVQTLRAETEGIAPYSAEQLAGQR